PLRPPPPRSTLFPYTTLFRSNHERHAWHREHGEFLDHSKIGFSIPLRRAHHTAQGWNSDSRDGRVDLIDRHQQQLVGARVEAKLDRKSTRLNSSHLVISYAVF